MTKQDGLTKFGEFMNTQGYGIDLTDDFWMEDMRYSEHKTRDIFNLCESYARTKEINLREELVKFQKWYEFKLFKANALDEAIKFNKVNVYYNIEEWGREFYGLFLQRGRGCNLTFRRYEQAAL